MDFVFPVETGSQKAFIGLAVVFTLIATVSVGLRLLARRINQRSLGLDDYLVLSSWVLLIGYQGINISAVVYGGMGFHAKDIESRFGIVPGESRFMKYFLAMSIIWCGNLALTKVAILALYCKIFTMRPFIIAARCATALVISCTTIMAIGSLTICRPLDFFWDRTLADGYCGDISALWISTASISLTTDFIVLLLPMPHLYSLEIKRPLKLALFGAFSLGVVTCVIGAVRLYMLVNYDPSDPTYNALPMMLLGFVEPAMGITLGCVPVLRPLLDRRHSQERVRTSKLIPLSSYAASTAGVQSRASRYHQTIGGSEPQPYPPCGITVEKSWDVYNSAPTPTKETY
ncbi:hypothetical protein MCOR27_005054 [Pyricularia oryzae]|uniref:Rhodopsin domain-containing protein n=3 Tax=Pyricularia TaxID=48558 RepID=A0ABQ8NPG4_PYRGI|nr:uncharacterized protein MGG_05386 [Pyricularia oryzae 70-15]KAH8841656.1 hypothetical protein MCOR01_005610 [Pyricularia oryzae]KAI6300160.1 hypothetical protein MCOR33_004053 [Pyricularia grisea]EHA57628.1 hypothetical protein MGG_05386 [Pyricularia oryzae 70-15]KAH9434816.1 hypothetical protein MCOR02_003780 [Pyricularia oryzae]KAI6253768.1 hypothetical protein MCOR19_009698 [Pyricularia oryzae]